MLKKFVIVFSVLSFVVLQACGTLLKPNQVNKAHSSRLDSTVVLLDALGLIFFLVPGVVSFVVDYSNGTLYLPAHHNKRISLSDTSNEGIQHALVVNNIFVSLEDIAKAKSSHSSKLR